VAFWACTQLQPQRQNLALGGLKLRGYDVYCPRIVERRNYGRRAVAVEAMLFPSYAFVLVIEMRWYDIVATPGVCRLIGNGAGPSQVPDRVIDEIRKREHNGIVQLPARGPAIGDPCGSSAGRSAITSGSMPA
jgi:transcription antitermination factor NusG